MCGLVMSISNVKRSPIWMMSPGLRSVVVPMENGVTLKAFAPWFGSSRLLETSLWLPAWSKSIG